MNSIRNGDYEIPLSSANNNFKSWNQMANSNAIRSKHHWLIHMNNGIAHVSVVMNGKQFK